MGGVGPAVVVVAQRLAISVADERSAVVALCGACSRLLEVLRFGEKREPAAEGLPVVLVIEAQEIGRSVSLAVGGLEGRGELDGRGHEAGGFDAQKHSAGNDAGPNPSEPTVLGLVYILNGGAVLPFDDGHLGESCTGMASFYLNAQRRDGVAVGQDLGRTDGHEQCSRRPMRQNRAAPDKADEDEDSDRREQRQARAERSSAQVQRLYPFEAVGGGTHRPGWSLHAGA